MSNRRSDAGLLAFLMPIILLTVFALIVGPERAGFAIGYVLKNGGLATIIGTVLIVGGFIGALWLIRKRD